MHSLSPMTNKTFQICEAFRSLTVLIYWSMDVLSAFALMLPAQSDWLSGFSPTSYSRFLPTSIHTAERLSRLFEYLATCFYSSVLTHVAILL